MFILLGLLALVVYINTVDQKQQRRKAQLDELERQRTEYESLIEKGDVEEAMDKFHSKKHTRHPSFCRCFKCSVKRTFTS